MRISAPVLAAIFALVGCHDSTPPNDPSSSPPANTSNNPSMPAPGGASAKPLHRVATHASAHREVE